MSFHIPYPSAQNTQLFGGGGGDPFRILGPLANWKGGIIKFAVVSHISLKIYSKAIGSRTSILDPGC